MKNISFQSLFETASVVKAFAKKTGKPEKEIEKMWAEVEKSVQDDGLTKKDPKYYEYIVGRLKKMLKINEEYLQEGINKNSINDALKTLDKKFNKKKVKKLEVLQYLFDFGFDYNVAKEAAKVYEIRVKDREKEGQSLEDMIAVIEKLPASTIASISGVRKSEAIKKLKLDFIDWLKSEYKNNKQYDNWSVAWRVFNP